MNPEWKKYTGGDEQIAELKESLNYNGFITGNSGIRWNKQAIPHEAALYKLFELATHYLICQPHPLADMIYQQARTGQPVYARYNDKAEHVNKEFHEHALLLRLTHPGGFPTNTPDWFNPYFEHSFTPFEEEE